jgi:hypothetical protein
LKYQEQVSHTFRKYFFHSNINDQPLETKHGFMGMFLALASMVNVSKITLHQLIS